MPSGNTANSRIAVSLLTGGSDKPYVIGLTSELVERGLEIDLIGSNELDCPELRNKPAVRFLNLRGDQRSDAPLLDKISRIVTYYAKLIRYAAAAKPKVFHILWNNKFEFFDRTLLMLYYKLLGKKIVFTAHNVNAARRDSQDTLLNRISLRIQYQLADCIFVHTEKMKQELVNEFGVSESRAVVIPFGINATVPNTNLGCLDARLRLGIKEGEKTLLFFGRIRPSKGLEFLVEAFRQIAAKDSSYRLIIAGKPDSCEDYWNPIKQAIQEDVESGRILLKNEFVPDEDTELYFKAADALVLPYRSIYQSGVLFLSYSFGLPVLVSDVGSLKDGVVEGKTGFAFKPEDPAELARAIDSYFASTLFNELSVRRPEIRDYAEQQHSWKTVGERTINVYASLLSLRLPEASQNHERAKRSLEPNSPL